MVVDFYKTIQAGGALILPTETVYGLFAQALNEEAVSRVYQLKRRPKEKAMNLNVASLKDIYQFSKDQPDYLPQLYQYFLPGPLTLILKANSLVPVWVNSGLETVGFRVPKHPVTLDVIEQTGPLIGPSANLSGKASGRQFSEISNQFDGLIQGYQDDLAISGQDSTILDLSGDKPRILRQGEITREALEKSIPQIVFH